ncbi:MAG: magnesium transporter CorA [Treponema sp. CETP13]|nr:MAG: magnesium transporter CorA [Treponema sp. CETP13]
MITFWQQEDRKVINRNEKELDTSLNTWVDVRSVTREDIRILEEEYHIEQEDILDILDQDELSRVEKEDNYTLIIMRLPVFIADNDISYFTLPVGIIIMEKKIITICWTDSEVLNDFSSNRIRSLSLNDFPAMVIRLLSRSDTVFLRYLKEINRRASTIQGELERSVKNNELLQLLNLQKSLEYFQTSLKGNQMLLEKLTRTKVLPLDEEDKDWLEDVNIDNRQALEMADTYSNILSGMTDTFASIISNNLNIVMKRLTSISLIMMVPTFIASFFGMNVPLPFENDGWMGVIIIGIICLLTATVTNFFLSDRRMSGESSSNRQKKKRTRHRINKTRKDQSK